VVAANGVVRRRSVKGVENRMALTYLAMRWRAQQKPSNIHEETANDRGGTRNPEPIRIALYKVRNFKK